MLVGVELPIIISGSESLPELLSEIVQKDPFDHFISIGCAGFILNKIVFPVDLYYFNFFKDLKKQLYMQRYMKNG